MKYYKYGVVLFEEMMEILWKNKHLLKEDGWVAFDYPDYYGLPKKIHSKLSSDVVGAIQDELNNLNLDKVTKAQFIKVFRENLFPLGTRR